MFRKKILFILPVLLCVSALALTMKANASENSNISYENMITHNINMDTSEKTLKASSNAQTVTSYDYLYEETFEKYSANTNWSRQAIYLENATGYITDNVDEIVDGNQSLKVVSSERGVWSALKIKSGTVEMKNSSYMLVIECKTNNIEAINIEVKKDYQNNFYAEYGIDITNDSNGNSNNIFYRKGNLNLDESSIENPVRKIENGIITMGFDFTSLDNLALVNICYKSVANEFGTMYIDNIKILDKNNPGKEFKVQYQSNFDNINSNSVFHSTPFWCGSGSMEFKNDNGNKSIVYFGNYYRANGDNVGLGGLTRTELETLPNKLYYYSYDIKLTEVQELVITTLDNRGTGKIYSEITYNLSLGGFKVTAAGGIKDFKAIYEDGVYHISYCRLTSDYGKDEHSLFATSVYGKESYISIDNFVVAYMEE